MARDMHIVRDGWHQNSTVVTTTVDSSTANIWYAVLGYTVDVAIGCVGISGVDTSATFIGGPGDVTPKFTRNYFRELSERTWGFRASRCGTPRTRATRTSSSLTVPRRRVSA